MSKYSVICPTTIVVYQNELNIPQAMISRINIRSFIPKNHEFRINRGIEIRIGRERWMSSRIEESVFETVATIKRDALRVKNGPTAKNTRAGDLAASSVKLQIVSKNIPNTKMGSKPVIWFLKLRLDFV
jgi:hypothetical protein